MAIIFKFKTGMSVASFIETNRKFQNSHGLVRLVLDDMYTNDDKKLNAAVAAFFQKQTIEFKIEVAKILIYQKRAILPELKEKIISFMTEHNVPLTID